MGKKIFVSYKYADEHVQYIKHEDDKEATTPRHYVDYLQSKLDKEDHINKGEKDGEDLSDFADETIWSALREKIYDSSITIVLISPGMKEAGKSEKEQWIPWEISYSLRESERNGRKSLCNGVLAVVLPDENGSCDYAIERKDCCPTNCNLWHTDRLFWILRKNMFNQYQKTNADCKKGDNVYHGWPSYIHMVRWDRFIGSVNYWIEKAEMIQSHKADYDIKVNMPDDI